MFRNTILLVLATVAFSFITIDASFSRKEIWRFRRHEKLLTVDADYLDDFTALPKDKTAFLRANKSNPAEPKGAKGMIACNESSNSTNSNSHSSCTSSNHSSDTDNQSLKSPNASFDKQDKLPSNDPLPHNVTVSDEASVDGVSACNSQDASEKALLNDEILLVASTVSDRLLKSADCSADTVTSDNNDKSKLESPPDSPPLAPEKPTAPNNSLEMAMQPDLQMETHQSPSSKSNASLQVDKGSEQAVCQPANVPANNIATTASNLYLVQEMCKNKSPVAQASEDQAKMKPSEENVHSQQVPPESQLPMAQSSIPEPQLGSSPMVASQLLVPTGACLHFSPRPNPSEPKIRAIAIEGRNVYISPSADMVKSIQEEIAGYKDIFIDETESLKILLVLNKDELETYSKIQLGEAPVSLS